MLVLIITALIVPNFNEENNLFLFEQSVLSSLSIHNLVPVPKVDWQLIFIGTKSHSLEGNVNINTFACVLIPSKGTDG